MVWQQKLLRWYRRHRRDLPWRRTQDPYRIWVSEVMLQQTTVEVVIPYYRRFIKRFPTARSLANASEEDVLRLWSGLGYYSRARNLREAARQIVTEYRGRLPESPEALQRLPGIGRYTAGAIASIAFGKRTPLLDGNVIRVLSRLFAIPQDPRSTQGKGLFWKKAEEVLTRKDCGDFNQALMELGATVCLPENPLCLLCPILSSCRAKKEGDPTAYPRGKKKQAYRDVDMTAAVIQRDGKVLMIQRPGNGLLKGMWELPMVEGGIRDLFQRWPLLILTPLPPVQHSVLNLRLRITPIACRLKRELPAGMAQRWIKPDQIDQVPTSSMNKKIIQILIGMTRAKNLRSNSERIRQGETSSLSSNTTFSSSSTFRISKK